MRASVTSVTAVYCCGEPGNTNGRPVFGPGDQRDVAERAAANGVKDIAQHRAVDPAILGLGCLA
jgi:hypothetical protein